MPTEFQMMTIADYWAILMRRKARFAIPFAVVVLVGVGLAFVIPPLYRSEATIMIERQSMPQDLVATTVTSYVQEQIEQIRQRLVAFDNIQEIAKTHNLYPDGFEIDPSGTAQLIAENIEVQMDEISATDPDRSGERRATIAFTVAFHHEDPLTAKSVTNELAQRYLAVHRATREEQARDVSEFLETEADLLRDEIATLEAAMATFKEGQLHRLPELMSMNLRMFEKTETEIVDSQTRIRNYEDTIDALQAELSLTPAYQDVETEEGERLLSEEKRLGVLTAQYLRASSRYAPKHPDVIRLAREIRILAEQTGQSVRVDELLSELAKLQDRLRSLRQRYSDGHPEVQAVEQSIAAMQRGLQTTVVGQSGANPIEVSPDNPRYVTLQSQINAATSNLTAERVKLTTLREKLTEYEERLFSTPGVERDFNSLSIDYQNKVGRYQEIKDKQLQARVAEQLESGESGERFILLSAAFLPSLPDSPNRIGIILLSGLLGFAVGLGSVAIAEHMDKTIRGARSLELALGIPPLATIPNGATMKIMLPLRHR
jgi:uncharacterized protein involved in exopolysaccharide biosynthesis